MHTSEICASDLQKTTTKQLPILNTVGGDIRTMSVPYM